MAEFILVQSIVALFFAIIFKSEQIIDIVFKMFFIAQTVWAVYLLFGPANIIQTLAR